MQTYKVTVYEPITYSIEANSKEEAIEEAKDKAAWQTFSMPEAFEVAECIIKEM